MENILKKNLIATVFMRETRNQRESRSTDVSFPSLHPTFPGAPHITAPGTMREIPTCFQTCDAHSAA